MNRIEGFTKNYRFLSNFYPAKIEFEYLVYPTVEHAYQAAKTMSMESRKRIASLETPGEAKKQGRLLKCREDWDLIKLQLMEELVYMKFSEHPKLTNALLSTLDSELIESNDHNDTFYGVCKGKGENHLGKILMKVRERLKNMTRLWMPRVFNRRIDLDWRKWNPVYVGRPSVYGNPFVLGVDGGYEEVRYKFKAWVILGEQFDHPEATEERRQILLNSLDELVGKNALCYCNPNPCHGDVLISLANSKHRLEGKPTIIAGSRDISNIKDLNSSIVLLNLMISLVISGTCKGVDKLGEQWAMENYVPVKRFPAQWVKEDGTHDRAAGHKRNREMGAFAKTINGRLLALWDGRSPGTVGMIKHSKDLKLETHVVVIEPWPFTT